MSADSYWKEKNPRWSEVTAEAIVAVAIIGGALLVSLFYDFERPYNPIAESSIEASLMSKPQ